MLVDFSLDNAEEELLAHIPEPLRKHGSQITGMWDPAGLAAVLLGVDVARARLGKA